MKKIIILSFACAMASTPALAQDDNWTGPYVGVNAGYGSAETRSDATLGGAWAQEPAARQQRIVDGLASKAKPDGAIYGFQLGYNQQVSPNFLLGAEADLSLMSIKHDESSTSAGAPLYDFESSFKLKRSIAVKAKAGFTTGSTLFYATGGWNWTRANISSEITSSGGYSKEGVIKKDLNGYVLGGGIEQKFSKKISLRLEYTYNDLGDVTYTTAYRPGSAFTSPVFSETVTNKSSLHAIKLGVNYSF